MKKFSLFFLIFLFPFISNAQLTKKRPLAWYNISGSIHSNTYINKDGTNELIYTAFLRDSNHLNSVDIDTMFLKNYKTNIVYKLSFDLVFSPKQGNKNRLKRNVYLGLSYFQIRDRSVLVSEDNAWINGDKDFLTWLSNETILHGMKASFGNEAELSIMKRLSVSAGLHLHTGISVSGINNITFKQEIVNRSPNNPGYTIEETLIQEETKHRAQNIFQTDLSIPLKLCIDVDIFRFYYGGGLTVNYSKILKGSDYWSYGWFFNTGFCFPYRQKKTEEM